MKVDSHLPIDVTLLYGNGDKVPDQSILETMGGRDIIISTQGMVSVKFRIREVSMKHENRKFCLRFSCQEQSYMTKIVTPVISTDMTVIRHKLKIRPSPLFPSVWYKDEGGRDKFINVDAILEDQNRNLVLDREVPLRVILTYAGDAEAEVKKQSILKLSNDSLPKIGRNGQVTLKVRIEDVSKNHQKQPFCVKIAPDTSYSPANYDIAMDVSPPIIVKSKRNKRTRKGSTVSRGSFDKKGKIDHSSHMAASSLLHMSGPENKNVITADQIAKLQSQADFGLILHMVKSWTENVYNGLRQMEWQHVGFELTETGQINLHRPLYRCPGCWSYKDTLREPRHQADCLVARPLQNYKRCSIEEHLNKMVNILKASGTNGSASTGTTVQTSLSSLAPAHRSTTAGALPSSSSGVHAGDGGASRKAGASSSGGGLSKVPLQPAFSIPRPPEVPKVSSTGSLGSIPNTIPPLPLSPELPKMNSTPSVPGLPSGLQPVGVSNRNISLGFLKSPTDDAFLFPNDEESVAAILVAQTPQGFPAYDERDKLIGFYVYDDHQTTITFFKLSSYKEVTEKRKEELEQIFQDQKVEKRSHIITKDQEIELGKMKEQVMMSIFAIMEDSKEFYH
eukprot:CAMPEP_0184491076 /NCGR_PEP_ID=MMETSP0113_2-20130426/19555_1 /TAXON_ID=91329 /ORGANISM="Norrisiella sphaerica, Strain BC52" /LENGTH=619 /DNA_ID=CAMNT_0026875275 /DNA_START=78 /DNA_END=1937 /DNA_ORIENTATION=+